MPIDATSLTKLFAHLPEVKFIKEGVKFSEYPFAPSIIYPSKLLVVADIKEINEKAAPPEIRTQHFHKFYWYAMEIALRAKELDKRKAT